MVVLFLLDDTQLYKEGMALSYCGILFNLSLSRVLGHICSHQSLRVCLNELFMTVLLYLIFLHHITFRYCIINAKVNYFDLSWTRSVLSFLLCLVLADVLPWFCLKVIEFDLCCIVEEPDEAEEIRQLQSVIYISPMSYKQMLFPAYDLPCHTSYVLI